MEWQSEVATRATTTDSTGRQLGRTLAQDYEPLCEPRLRTCGIRRHSMREWGGIEGRTGVAYKQHALSGAQRGYGEHGRLLSLPAQAASGCFGTDGVSTRLNNLEGEQDHAAASDTSGIM
jgi:hypothetical protein